MKVAISCDALTSRNYVTSIVEAFLMLFEEAEIFTLVHHEGKIIGPVEQRKIHSTYLTNVIGQEKPFGDQWWKKGLLIPGASKNLTIPCNVDLLINVSSGFSQGFTRCKGVYQITYLVENQFLERTPKFIREKLFRPYLEYWAEKSLAQSDEMWLPSESSFNFWKQKVKNASILLPFIKASDYPLLPKGMRENFPKDFICIDAQSVDEIKAEYICDLFKKEKIKFKFIGNDEHLEKLKQKTEPQSFFGERCSGELAPLISAARGLVSFQRKGFPARAIESLSCGTPVCLLKDSDGHKYVSGEGVFTMGVDATEIIDIFNLMKDVDPQKVHGLSTKFHDLKFRAEVKRRIDKAQENLNNSHKANC